MIFAWVSLIWQRVQGFSRRGAVEHSWEVVTSPLIRAAQYVAAVLKTFDDGACGNARSRQLAGKDRHKKTAVKHKKKRNKRKKKKAKKNAGRGQSSQSGDVSARPDDGLREGCVQKVVDASSSAVIKMGEELAKPHRGLVNKSTRGKCWQRCYLHAAVQAMHALPKLRGAVATYFDLFLKTAEKASGGGVTKSSDARHNDMTFSGSPIAVAKNPLLLELAKLLKVLDKDGEEPYDASAFERALRQTANAEKNVLWKECQQQDSCEVFAMVMTALSEVCPLPKENGLQTPATLGFMTFEQETCFKCEQCGMLSVKAAQVATSVQLPLDADVGGDTTALTLDKCASQMFGGVQHGLEKFCACCGTNAQHSLSSELTKMPEELVLQLKRFKTDDYGRITKIMDVLIFPLDVMYLGPDGTKSDSSGKAAYMLTAVVQHHGSSVDSGHCTTLVRQTADLTSAFTLYDDATVRSVDRSSVVTNAAYQLVYRRLDALTAMQLSGAAKGGSEIVPTPSCPGTRRNAEKCAETWEDNHRRRVTRGP